MNEMGVELGDSDDSYESLDGDGGDEMIEIDNETAEAIEGDEGGS